MDSRPRRPLLRDVVLVLVVTAGLTAAWAWPVLQSPERRVVGEASAGPHPDPFVMAGQYARGDVPSPYLQPATDLPEGVIAVISKEYRVGQYRYTNLDDALAEHRRQSAK